MKRLYPLFALIVLTITSCINIRTEYPQIDYYKLESVKSVISTDLKIDGVLQIRDCHPAENVDTDHLYATWDNKNVRKYYYHRWVSDFPSLLTDFFKQRYSELNIFKSGVVNSSTILAPDYTLELRLLKMDAYSSEKYEKDSCFVEVSMQAVFSKKPDAGADPQVIVSETFTTKAKRPNNEVTSIAPAFSKAFSDLSDRIFVAFYDAEFNKR